jgi:hypothetical protein
VVERVARAIYEAAPIIIYPNIDCIDSKTVVPWSDLLDDEMESRRSLARAAIAAISSIPKGDETGRVEVGPDDPLAKALQPSKEAIERIGDAERARADGAAAVRNMLLGSASPKGDEGERARELLAQISDYNFAQRLRAGDTSILGLESISSRKVYEQLIRALQSSASASLGGEG